MSKYVKVEDVIDLINGLDSLPFEEETEEIVNCLPIYDAGKVIERVEEIGNIQFSSFTKPLITVEDVLKIFKEAGGEDGRNES